MSHTPTCDWQLQPGNSYLTFLSHYKVEAGSDARYLTDLLQRMGVSTIRLGGSFASVTGWPDGGGGTPPSTDSGRYYQWQKWTGPPYKRPSVGAVWNAYDGTSYSLLGGWGPFEHIDSTRRRPRRRTPAGLCATHRARCRVRCVHSLIQS